MKRIVTAALAVALVASACSTGTTTNGPEGQEKRVADAPQAQEQAVAVAAPEVTALAMACSGGIAADAPRFDSLFVINTSAVDTTVGAFKTADLGEPIDTRYRVNVEGVVLDPTLTKYEFATAQLGGSVVFGQPPATIEMAAAVVDHLLGLPDDVRLFVAMSQTGGADAIIEDASDTVFVSCFDGYTEFFSEFRSARPELDNGSGIDMIIAMFNPSSPLAEALDDVFAIPEPVAWSDRAPADRLLDQDEMPEDVFASLLQTTFVVDFGQGWRSLGEVTLCSRIQSLGWNECVRPVLAHDGSLRLRALVAEGQDLELWLLDKDATVSDPIAFVGVIESRDAAQATDGDTHVTLKAVSGVDDIESRQGTLILSITRGASE